MKSNNYTEEDFRKFANQFEWTFAKTYAQKAPNSYGVKQVKANRCISVKKTE